MKAGRCLGAASKRGVSERAARSRGMGGQGSLESRLRVELVNPDKEFAEKRMGRLET